MPNASEDEELNKHNINKRFSKIKETRQKLNSKFKAKLEAHKTRNSDENRMKRIKSRTLELQEENLKTKISKSKKSRGGLIQTFAKGGTNPQRFGLQKNTEGFGSNVEMLAKENNFGGGLGDMFGTGGGTKQRKGKKGKIFGARKTKRDGLSDLF